MWDTSMTLVITFPAKTHGALVTKSGQIPGCPEWELLGGGADVNWKYA